MAFKLCMLLYILNYTILFTCLCLTNGNLLISILCCYRLPKEVDGTWLRCREQVTRIVLLQDSCSLCFRMSFLDIQNLYSLNRSLCKATELV
jgi:hypothetical protein